MVAPARHAAENTSACRWNDEVDAVRADTCQVPAKKNSAATNQIDTKGMLVAAAKRRAKGSGGTHAQTIERLFGRAICSSFSDLDSDSRRN